MSLTRKTTVKIVPMAGVALIALILLVALVPPAATVSASSNSFRVVVHPNTIEKNGSVSIKDIIRTKPHSTCSVTNTVTGPLGVRHSKTTHITLNNRGAGTVTMTYPDHFSNNPTTGPVGEYDVSATLTCSYYVSSARASFHVTK
jgi:hypothetical protein